MSKSAVLSVGVRRVVPLFLALALVLSWTAAAHAQPSAGQYGNPTATASGNPAASGNDASAATGATAVAASAAPGGGPSATVLPLTGGPLLVLVALGGLALGSTGLLALRRNSRR